MLALNCQMMRVAYFSLYQPPSRSLSLVHRNRKCFFFAKWQNTISRGWNHCSIPRWKRHRIPKRFSSIGAPKIMQSNAKIIISITLTQKIWFINSKRTICGQWAVFASHTINNELTAHASRCAICFRFAIRSMRSLFSIWHIVHCAINVCAWLWFGLCNSGNWEVASHRRKWATTMRNQR